MKRSIAKKILWVTFSLGAGIGGAFLLLQGSNAVYAYLKPAGAMGNTLVASANVSENQSAAAVAAAPSSSLIHLTFVGDIMLGRGVKTSVYNNFGGDYLKLFENVAPLFSADDITFANLEGPISTRGVNVGSKFSFRFEPKVADALKSAGVDIVSVANNHEGDWTSVAYEDTLAYLAKAGVQYAGGGEDYAKATTPTIIVKNGVKIGFLGFTDVGPDWMPADSTHAGVLLASDPNFDSIVKNAATQADILIVSFHFGVEYNVGKHTLRQEKLAHEVIDDGAKLVIGAHPHVGEDIQEYNGGLIAYSLGNFIFDQPFSKDTMHGEMLEVTLDKAKIASYAVKTVQMNSYYQPSEIASLQSQ